MDCTLEQFRRAWYRANVSHDPDYERDTGRLRSRWRGTVLTARTWRDMIERTSGVWQTAACNECLPSQLDYSGSTIGDLIEYGE